MQISLLVFLLIVAYIYLYRNAGNINLFYFFIICNCIFYLLYPLSDLVNGQYEVSDPSLVFMYIYLTASLILLGIFYRTFLNKIEKHLLSIQYLLDTASGISIKKILILLAINFAIIFYYFFQHNLIFRIVAENSDITNSYGIVVGSIIVPIFLTLEIIVLNKLYRKHYDSRMIRLTLISILIVCFIFFLFYGRRELIMGVLIFVIVQASKNRYQNFLHPRRLLRLVIGAFLIILGSNFYQNIRDQVLTYSTNKEFSLDKPVYTLFTDFEASSSNLGERTSVLYMFDQVVVNNEMGNNSDGEVLRQNLITNIPRVLYPEKISVNEDVIVSRTLGIRSTDYNVSIAMLMLMDFSYLAFLLYPLVLILFWKISIRIIAYLKHEKMLFVLLTTVMLTSAFNIEGSIASLLGILRNFIVIFIVYALARMLKLIKVHQ